MKTYAVVGLGHRSYMYLGALTGAHRDDGRLVGLCDSNPGRLTAAAGFAAASGLAPQTFPAEAFDRMIAETSPDRVIVTVPDNVHADYIVRALEAGCDVITEKPLTMDAESCARIIAARRRKSRGSA